MNPTYEADIRLDDGTEVCGKVMYLVVWEGKALSGGEVLVRGDQVEELRVDRSPDAP